MAWRDGCRHRCLPVSLTLVFAATLSGVTDPRQHVSDLLAQYVPDGATESTDVARVRDMVHAAPDPWSRSLPLHVTASALIVHPPSRRVLLRWHKRQQAWLQVGGHGDPGESDPLDVALREGSEETGLNDLVAWPDSGLVHVAVVAVSARGDEPAHEHADLRFVLATGRPDDAVPEAPDAPLRWLGVGEAYELIAEENVRETLRRVEALLGYRSAPVGR